MAIITISRGTMSGGKKLAECLSEKLGYNCVSREIIVKAAEEYGVPEGKLIEAIRKSPSIFQKLTFDRERYLAYIQAALCEYAVKDNLIYHGNAGHFLLPGVSHVLRVRLVADMPYRIRATMAELSLSKDEAVKYIRSVDSERVKWTKFLYGKDWSSPELYDLIFNLERTDINFVCEMVKYAVSQPEFQTTPESTKAMKDLLDASKLRAGLAEISNIRLEYIDIRADDKAVTISGRVKTQKLMDDIMEIAGKMPEFEKIENNIQVDYKSYGVE